MSPNLSMFSSSVKKAIQTLFLVAPLMLLSACLPEEKDDTTPISNEDRLSSQFILSLNGFWDGGFEQSETLRVLIYNGNVYGLDEDKAFYGSVYSPKEVDDGEVDFTFTSYPFAYTDDVNFEYVTARTPTNYSVEGLLATETLVVGDYKTSNNEYGTLELNNDRTYNSPSSLSLLVGEWTTNDLRLNINKNGRFHGVNNAEANNCAFEGFIKVIDASKSIFSLELNRRNCDDFNGDSTGYAAINADGELEFYSKMGSSLLFMTFTAPTGNASNPETDPAEEETPAEQAP